MAVLLAVALLISLVILARTTKRAKRWEQTSSLLSEELSFVKDRYRERGEAMGKRYERIKELKCELEDLRQLINTDGSVIRGILSGKGE